MSEMEYNVFFSYFSLLVVFQNKVGHNLKVFRRLVTSLRDLAIQKLALWGAVLYATILYQALVNVNVMIWFVLKVRTYSVPSCISLLFFVNR